MNSQKKQVEFFRHCNQQAMSYPSPQCLIGVIQAQEVTLLVDTNQTLSKELHHQHICGALHDLVPFVQLKKRKKHPWGSVTFNKVAEKISLYMLDRE